MHDFTTNAMNNMLRLIILTGCLFALSINTCNADGSKQLDLLKSNYKSILLLKSNGNDILREELNRIKPETEMSDQVVVELHQRYPFDLKKIAAYLSALSPEGTWADINYQDTKRSGWEPKLHADRILELSKLYHSPGTRYFHSPEVMACIRRALRYWFEAQPKCKNWWYNQIGIPKTLGAAFILLEDLLSPEEKAAAIRVMQSSQFGMTGQNKVWLAGNVLIRGLLENDEQLVKAARDTIASEIVLGRREGIKNDWSFHQHGPQLQFGNYGLSYVTGMSFFNRLFQGTDFAFDEEQLNILLSLVNNGFRWTIWNRHMDVNALGRQLFHNAQLHKSYGLAFAAVDLGLGKEFSGTTNTLTGHKHFDDSDYAVHRTPRWMASVRMSSNRVIGTELVNEDNLKGYYLGDGATYFYTQGDEYLNVFPFWDWRKIPGVTAYETDAPVSNINRTRSGNRSDRVGGLSNGRQGMAAMELNRDRLKAYKAWVFTDDYVVCMGTGIEADTLLMVTTSIEQCLKKGDLSVWNGKEWATMDGTRKLSAPDLRFFHNRTGYIVLGGDTCIAEAKERTGQWADFMKMYRPATVEGEVVSLHLQHGVQPRQGAYLYIVFPSSQRSSVDSFDTGEVEVLRNDSVAQIVSLPRQRCCWACVYTPGEINIEGKNFSIDAPGIYYLEKAGNEQLSIKLEQAFRITGRGK